MDPTAPKIEAIDARLVELSSTVVMPRRIRARFDRTPAVIIDIEIVDRRPVVRSVTIGSADDNLASGDVRIPLTGELVPTAIRAASQQKGQTLLFGPPPDGSERPLHGGVKHGQVGVIGPIRGIARVRQHLDDYEQAARESAPRRRGRPTKRIHRNELEEIAATYRETGSFTETAARHRTSEATIRRRIKLARDEGLEC